MYSKLQRNIMGVVIGLMVGALVTGSLLAGSLEPAAPLAPTMHTLEEIFQRPAVSVEDIVNIGPEVLPPNRTTLAFKVPENKVFVLTDFSASLFSHEDSLPVDPTSIFFVAIERVGAGPDTFAAADRIELAFSGAEPSVHQTYHTGYLFYPSQDVILKTPAFNPPQRIIVASFTGFLVNR